MTDLTTRYFLIYGTEDGGQIQAIGGDELLDRLTSGYYGDMDFIKPGEPFDGDTNYWGEGVYLLIKGEIVVPKAKETVTEYEL